MTSCREHGLQSVQSSRDVVAQVFIASATMSGVCLTVIGLLHIQFALRETNTFADDLLVGNALLYMVACLLSYAVLRRPSAHVAMLAWLVDASFMAALMLTTGIGGVIAWSILQ